MGKGKIKLLIEHSVSAMISAIEIYNKPDFKYREETFSILAINAWELLLKAKVLRDNNNELKSIYIPNKTKTKRGKPLKRFYPDLNRSNNPYTIGISDAIKKVELPNELKENIELLIEIRDNAIHFMNDDAFLSKKVLDIGTANLKSYLNIVNDWFDYDLSRFNFYLMPISFFHTFEIESYSINNKSKQQVNLINHILNKENEYPSDIKKDHNISLNLVTKLTKSMNPDALNVKYSDDADITLKVDTEERFKKKYQMDYYQLLDKMKARYSDFVQNNDFYRIKRELGKHKKYSDKNYLDIFNKKGVSKIYYSTEVFKEFDKHYTKK